MARRTILDHGQAGLLAIVAVYMLPNRMHVSFVGSVPLRGDETRFELSEESEGENGSGTEGMGPEVSDMRYIEEGWVVVRGYRPNRERGKVEDLRFSIQLSM